MLIVVPRIHRDRHPHLTQVRHAIRRIRRTPHLRHQGKGRRRQQDDDRHHHQQLHQGEPPGHPITTQVIKPFIKWSCFHAFFELSLHAAMSRY